MKHDHIENIRKELRWLPIEFRIKFKIILLTFKCLNDLAPKYLQDLLEVYKPQRNLRSADNGYLKVHKTRTRLGERAFRIMAPALWNELPGALRSITDIDAFKTTLKTHFFTIAFK